MSAVGMDCGHMLVSGWLSPSTLSRLRTLRFRFLKAEVGEEPLKQNETGFDLYLFELQVAIYL
jgi:hypothetical protein